MFLQKDRDKVKLNVNKQTTLGESMERISVNNRVAVKSNANSLAYFLEIDKGRNGLITIDSSSYDKYL